MLLRKLLSIVAGIFLSASACCGQTLVQSTGALNSGGSSGTVSYTSNVTAGNLLIVIYPVFNSSPPTPTDTLANTWINLSFLEGPGGTALKTWIAVANSSGADTISYSGFPGTNEGGVFLEEWSGVGAVAFAGSATTASLATLLCMNNAAPLTTQGGVAIFFGYQSSNTAAMTVTPGTTRQSLVNADYGYSLLADTSFSTQTTPSIFAATWTTGGGNDSAVEMIFLFPPAGSGSGATNSGFAN